MVTNAGKGFDADEDNESDTSDPLGDEDNASLFSSICLTLEYTCFL